MHGFAVLQKFPAAQAAQLWAMSAMWAAATHWHIGVGIPESVLV